MGQGDQRWCKLGSAGGWVMKDYFGRGMVRFDLSFSVKHFLDDRQAVDILVSSDDYLSQISKKFWTAMGYEDRIITEQKMYVNMVSSLIYVDKPNLRC